MRFQTNIFDYLIINIKFAEQVVDTRLYMKCVGLDHFSWISHVDIFTKGKRII